VLCGSALKNKGVQLLMDAVVDFLPSPLEVPPVQGVDPKGGGNLVREPGDFESLSALVFKIATDSYVGKLAYVRVYSGMLQEGKNAYNPRTGKRERINRIIKMHADKRTPVDNLYTGEIGAIPGLKHATTGDTLCLESSPIVLERIEFPEPVIAMAIEPRTSADRDSLIAALAALSDEDPTFRVTESKETGQTLISGMGELHLDIIKDRMFREFKVQARAGAPMVAYRETIKSCGSSDKIFEREISGHGQYAHIILNVLPRERGSGNLVTVDVSKEIIPGEFRVAIEVGVADGLATGVLGNYPIVDVEVRVVGGDAHPVDSTEMAFRSVAVMALKDAVRAADAVLLEPVMEVEVTTPEESMGEVLSDINGRRGRIEEMKALDTASIVRAEVPLAELFGYATSLRSLTKGRASYTMEPKMFAALPILIQETILNR
jgi:elongation factor G